jgi:hypothetical protein
LRPRASIEQQLTPHNPAENRRGHQLRKSQNPRNQHIAFKKGTTPKRRRWPVRQSRPRVSPDMKGRNGPTQEHASKEEVAPVDVTVFHNGNAVQGFHPGREPHPGGTETGATSSQRTTATGSMSTRRGMSSTTAAVPSAVAPRRDRDGHSVEGRYPADSRV